MYESHFREYTLIDLLKKQGVPMTAAFYARYSSENQREASIEFQRDEVSRFANANGIEVVSEYIDRAKSAKSGERDSFQKMINDSKTGEFRIVLVYKYDRFFREQDESGHYQYLLKRNKVALYSVTEPFYPNQPMSYVMKGMTEGNNQMYLKNLANLITEGQRKNAEKSLWTGGVPPYGYDVDRITKQLVVNHHEAVAVKLIFKMFIEKAGYLVIANELNRLGYKTKRGGDFTKTSFNGMLKNEVYIGNFCYGKQNSRNYFGDSIGGKYRPRSQWICNEGAVEPIVTREVFDYAQKILEENRHKFPAPKPKEKYLLSGKIHCGVCGGLCYGDRRKNGSGNVYVTYVCNQKKRRGNNGCTCPAIEKRTIENYVIDEVCHRVFCSCHANIKHLTRQVNLHLESEFYQSQTEGNALSESLAQKQRDMDKLFQLILRHDSASLVTRLDQMQKEVDSLSQNLRDSGVTAQYQELSQNEVNNAIQLWIYFIRKYHIGKVKELIATAVDDVVLYPGRVVVKIKSSRERQQLYSVDS